MIKTIGDANTTTENHPSRPIQEKRAQHFILAEKLHKTIFINALHGALDGQSLSYSTIKYCFDILFSEHNGSVSDLMHDWMVTPTGALCVASESIALISFSMMANIFNDKDKNKFKRFIALIWPYCRDILKGLKNGYKGFKCFIQATAAITGQNLRYLVAPMGFLLGLLLALKRVLIRKIVKDHRKTGIQENTRLLLEIQHAPPKEAQKLSAGTFKSNKRVQYFAYFASLYGGAVDGLYLNFGVFGLGLLTPEAFLAIFVCCVFFTIVSIVTEVYQEHIFNKELVSLEIKIELALCGKELEDIFSELQKISDEIANQDLGLQKQKLPEKQDQLSKQLDSKLNEFKLKKEKLRSCLSVSNKGALLLGLKDGWHSTVL